MPATGYPPARRPSPDHRFAAAALAAALGSVLTAQAAPPPAGDVTIRDGHLSRNGERLRLWGVNVQSGVFKSYDEIDRLIPRLVSLGFNGVRLWATPGTFYRGGVTAPVDSKRGDGSDLDRFDYVVAKASAAGLAIQMTMLSYVDVPTLKATQAPEIRAWIGAARNERELRTLHGFAPYVSPAYRDMIETHMSHVLARVNPYTGRTYANEPAVSTWELANESRFVECALAPACVGDLPPIALQTLSTRWQESPLNAGHAALPADLKAMVASPAYPAYARFVVQAFQTTSNHMRAHARQAGGPNADIAVQPFIFNTGPGEANLVAQYAYSSGDVFSIGSYSSPLKQGGIDGSAWQPASSGGPLPANTAQMKVQGKPLIMYETSFFRPFPYRSEWGPVLAAVALQQDWDGVFLYQYGQPQAIYTMAGKPDGYGAVALSEQARGGDYTLGFNHGSDPEAMASWSVAGSLFRSVTETPTAQTLWRIPLADLFRAPGSKPANWPSQREAAVKAMLTTVAFADDAAHACMPCEIKGSSPRSFHVDWNVEAANLTIKTPGGTLVSGRLAEGPLTMFGPGIGVSVVKGGFGVVAVTAPNNGQGAAGAKVVVIGEVRNSAANFDQKLVNFASATGAMAGVQDKGGLPLVYSGPVVELRTGSPSDFEEENFGLAAIRTLSGNSYRYDASKGVFRVELK